MNTPIQNMLSDLEDVRNLLAKQLNLSELPTIERDIILAKLRLVYENIITEKNILTSENENLLQKPVESVTEKNEEKLFKTGDLKETGFRNEVTTTEKPATPLKDDILTIEEDNTQQKHNEILKEPAQKPTASDTQAHSEKTIIAEKYHKNETYVNEILAQGLQKKDISSLMQTKPVRDIEAAIGINERFIFIKELFSGDGETYLKTIRILNNAANFNEAFNYIRQTYSWNLDGEAAQKLLDVVRRRFIVDAE